MKMGIKMKIKMKDDFLASKDLCVDSPYGGQG